MAGLTLPNDCESLSAAYRRDGAVPVRGLLSGTLLADLVAAIQAFRDGGGEAADPRTSVKHLPGRSIVRGLAHTEGVVRDLVTNPQVAMFMAAVTGAPALRYWNDLTLVYAPAAPAGESLWHHDLPAFPLRSAHMPTLWIALSSVDADTSPLVYVPGSHMSEHLYPPSTASAGTVPAGYTAMPDWDAEAKAGAFEKLWWPMEPGDAIIMDAKVVHCTPANRNETDERVSLLIRWLGEDAVWHRDAFSTPVPGIPEADWQPGQPAPAAFV